MNIKKSCNTCKYEIDKNHCGNKNGVCIFRENWKSKPIVKKEKSVIVWYHRCNDGYWENECKIENCSDIGNKQCKKFRLIEVKE